VAAAAVKRLALFMPSFRGGGAERVMLNLAGGFAAGGLAVDVLVAQREGPLADQLDRRARVVHLEAPRILAALPGLVRYLRREQPDVMLSALPHTNVVAVWARSLARSGTRLVLSEHTTASVSASHAAQRRARILPVFMRFAYRHADGIVAVSAGVADDLAELLNLDRTRITPIHNPVVTPELLRLAAERPDHPWFADGQPPVILGAGRLTPSKDFPTLVRAFAAVRRQRAARLAILGEGAERRELEALVQAMGLESDVWLPGFVPNPFQYMHRASVFALSSRWEGFGNVLVEAMACGTPVVSTDCPVGPREILEAGRHGRLTPVGDAEALARAISAQLDDPITATIAERARAFSLDIALSSYRQVLRI
jgi:glycosyltransferase involved in cell wall biosynthesis